MPVSQERQKTNQHTMETQNVTAMIYMVYIDRIHAADPRGTVRGTSGPYWYGVAAFLTSA